MATASLSAGASRSTAQQSCSRWLREALVTARRALRKQKETWTTLPEDRTRESLPHQDVVPWDRECEFAGQKIDNQTLIYASTHSFCLLTPRPVVRGHAIVCPRKPARALFDLTKEEADDLFLATHVLSWMLTAYYGSTATTLRLQQGEGTHQTLPHLFVHVVPRKTNDLPCNDDIYMLLDDAVPLFDALAAGTEAGDGPGDAPRGDTGHGQHFSLLVDKYGGKTPSPAEIEQQSQEIRTWLVNLVLD